MSPVGFICCRQARDRWAELLDSLPIEFILIQCQHGIPFRNGVILRSLGE